MVLPCAETFGPSRLAWTARIGITTSADFWSHGLSCPNRPAFQAKPYSPVRFQISPDKGT